MAMARQGNTLADWLAWQEQLHPKTIDMSLERVRLVKEKMKLYPACPIVLVGGTNGKGSVCAMLSSILYSAGFKVGTHISPHLLQYNERVMIDMQPVSDERIVESFTAIEAVRGDISLTYFEFATLAAVHTFVEESVDAIVLEVGMGGRLDAVNAFDPDVSIVTNVDMDHQSYLGNTINAIALEKAGIFRSGKPALYGALNPPTSLVNWAKQIGAKLKCYGQDFTYVRQGLQWSFHMGSVRRHALPIPALRGDYQLGNASLALAALEYLKEKLPVSQGAIKRGLLEVNWPGRFQVLPGRPMLVLDVGHNPHGVKSMVDNLKKLPFSNKCYAVFSMLADKDIESVMTLTKDQFDAWFVAGLSVARGLSTEELTKRMQQQGIQTIHTHATIQQALEAALSQAEENDIIMAFGSFHTVAAVLAHRQGYVKL